MNKVVKELDVLVWGEDVLRWDSRFSSKEKLEGDEVVARVRCWELKI